MQKPFNHASNNFRLDKQKAVWKAIPYRESEKEDHKYIEGLQKLGDDLIDRTRDKSKEVA